MTGGEIIVTLVVAVAVGLFLYGILRDKKRLKDREDYPQMSDPLPPLLEKEDKDEL